MALLIVGLVVFLGIHSISIVAPGLRERLYARFGDRGWKAIYSVIALVGFVLLVKGYAMAREAPVLLYSPPGWTRHLIATLMLPVFPLLFASHLPGRIKALAGGHPMLVATKLWATAHLLGTTTLADAVLFGAILAWAVADFISVRRRPARTLRSASPGRFNDAIALVGGLAFYAVFAMKLHLWLIGIAPFAR